MERRKKKRPTTTTITTHHYTQVSLVSTPRRAILSFSFRLLYTLVSCGVDFPLEGGVLRAGSCRTQTAGRERWLLLTLKLQTKK
jgi:hypothetical protein